MKDAEELVAEVGAAAAQGDHEWTLKVQKVKASQRGIRVDREQGAQTHLREVRRGVRLQQDGERRE